MLKYKSFIYLSLVLNYLFLGKKYLLVLNSMINQTHSSGLCAKTSQNVNCDINKDYKAFFFSLALG